MDRITLHGIEVHAHHGVLPEERLTGQPFLVHATIELDAREAAESDDLTATVDYAALAGEIAAVAAQGPHHLIETVAAQVCEALLAHPRVRAAEVTVEKPHAPLPVPAAGVSVTVRRPREA
ncbi:MAG TPA: dihydroneopterin aldolase [Nitriliruptorales bacterium]|nr:dihydroneopterin aldolase [Nitriliruptorales bacterium]